MSGGPRVAVVAASPAMRAALDQVALAAPTDATVLLLGETGTGKEVLARELHARSRRADGPFVAVNCGALQSSVVESELFGHVRGAFTGATADKDGLFVAAGGGTLFLDEVGELSASAQVLLLRALQERRIRRVGDTRERAVDVRVVAATHRDLAALARTGAFREDLFYRLQVVAITLPPLRDRREDIPALVEALLAESARRHGRPCTLTSEAARLLSADPWPGNVRELAHFLERLVVLAHPGAGGDPARLDAADVRALRPAPPLARTVGSPAPGAADTRPAAPTGRGGAGRWVVRWWRFERRRDDDGSFRYVRFQDSLDRPDRATALARGPTRIGREITADLVFDSDEISRLHATFIDESERLEIEDGGSKNGTFVDGLPLPPGARAVLRAGSVVRLGKEWLGLVLDADAGPAPAALPVIPAGDASGAVEIKSCEQALIARAASRTAPSALTADDLAAALHAAGGNKRQAAKLLRISPQSLYTRLRELGLAED